jgi:hypothetical protein
MTRFSRKAADEVPDRDGDNARRRIAPRVAGMPLSPKAISNIYKKGKTVTQPKDPEHQPPQFREDQHAKGYDNDCSGWVRGAGGDGRGPCFDHGKLDPASKPPRPAKGLRATGQDMTKSPFSKAHRTFGED